MPLLALMLFGAIEIGRLMHDYQLVEKSVRHAVRYLSRVDMTCAGATATLVNATDDNIARNLAISGEIAKDISEMNQAANEMTNSSSQVNLNSQDLSKLAVELKEMTQQFKV